AREDDPLYPAQQAPFYLSSKLTGEIYAEHFRLARGLPVTILRVSSPYGPYMKPRSLVARFVTQLRAGQPVEVADGGRYTVDLVHIDDVAQAVFLAVDRAADGIYNIGAGAA